jgi:hypothetical protein
MPELTDSESLRERIVADSKKYLTAGPQADEFTIADFMRWNQTTDRDAVRRALVEMEEDGLIYKRKGRMDGSSINVYGYLNSRSPTP